MKKIGNFIAKNRIAVLIIATFLLIPSFVGMAKTRVNYDMLEYLPSKIDSVKGQRILNEKFSNAVNCMLIVENMESKDVIKLKNKVKKVEGVDNVVWIDDIADTTLPKDVLPDEIKESFYSGNSTMMIISFNDSASSKSTQDAIAKIRKISGKQTFLSGAAAVVKDTKDLSDKETPFYVLLAVVLSIIVLCLTMESTVIPFIFLLSMGYAILYNFGTNIIFESVSYVTKSIAAVLQLGVTMDYSIFLLHRYDEEKEKLGDKEEAMGEAIANTIAAISGSSLTTIAGFLALCTMQLSLGKDIGFVMAKGVFLGVITTVTVLPALILFFDKPIHKFHHKTILPEFNKVADTVSSKYKRFVAIFLIAFIPAIYGNNNLKVYYNLDKSLPQDLPSIVAINKLKDDYNMTTTHFVILNDNIPSYKTKDLISSIENVKGVEKVLGYDKFAGPLIPQEFIPEDIKTTFKQGGYNLILVNSKYKAATEEERNQLKQINKIVKKYDKDAKLTGEAPLTEDLITLADKDFKTSNAVSIGLIFLIISIVFMSFSLPILLVLAIELAIFINMSISFYMGTTVPFVASIVIGCIQLGSTVDYAILLTSRFKEEINNGYNKFEAMDIAVNGSAKSIVTSALTFFAATAGVGIVSNLSIIKTLCSMMARGALISMAVILFLLPSILLVSEKFIAHTSKNWKINNNANMKENLKERIV